MSYAWLLGGVCGIIIVLVVWAFRWKRTPSESDERTALIRTQAGATAFYITMGFTCLAWLGDNALAYSQGAPPRIVSPWSTLLAAMLFIYLGSVLYRKWQFSVRADLDAHERAQARKRAAALLAGAAALGASVRLAFEHEERALGWFLLALMCTEMVTGLYLMARAMQRSASD